MLFSAAVQLKIAPFFTVFHGRFRDLVVHPRSPLTDVRQPDFFDDIIDILGFRWNGSRTGHIAYSTEPYLTALHDFFVVHGQKLRSCHEFTFSGDDISLMLQ